MIATVSDTDIPSPPDLMSFRCIVVKIGSSLLVDRTVGGIRASWLASCIDDIIALLRSGVKILIVSSGAVALGRIILDLPGGSLKLEDTQAAAAVGQIDLLGTYARGFARHDLRVAQVLLTIEDTENRRRYLNACDTFSALLRMNTIPVINENDTVATSEIRYGDNDRLAARVASMVSADCLILLSDVDGLYTARPDIPGSVLIRHITSITPEIEGMAVDSTSDMSRGGMVTKLEAGKIALAAGVHMVIANGKIAHPLMRLREGNPASWFIPDATPVTARNAWIGGSLLPKGSLFLDSGAVQALKCGKSLLPVGVVRVEGNFSRGDPVIVKEENGREIGRGLIAHDYNDVRQIMGCKSSEVESILGHAGRHALIHRDDFVLC